MSFNVAMLEAMQAEGLDLDACIRVLKAGEKRTDPTAAERMRAMRTRRKDAAVTRNVTHEPPNDNISIPPPLAKAKCDNARGTRLPDDFLVPEDWITWAMTKRRWPRSDAVEESEQFCRYWQARTGSAATKRDWFKTWQQWVTNSHRKASAVASATPARDMTAEGHEKLAEFQTDRDPVKAEFHRREAATIRNRGPTPIGSLVRNIQTGVGQ